MAFLDLPPAGGEKLDAGDYPAVIRRLEPYTSQAGNDCLIVEVGAWNGSRFVDVTTFVPLKVKFRVDNFVSYVFPDHEGGEVDLESAIGKEVRVKVKLEPYEGNIVERLDRFVDIDPEDRVPESAAPATADDVPWA